MTPREKAHDLLYRYLHSGKLHNTKVKYMGAGQMKEHYDENVEIESAKQCALIAVEEIVQVTHEDPYPRKKCKMDKEYWEQVKQEIEKV